MMKIYDISVTLEAGIPIWPGNPPFELERVAKIEDGASSNVSRLALGVHTGTHVDAPVHFLPGRAGVDALPLDVLNGEALLAALDLPSGNITAAALGAARIPSGVSRLLIKTRNSDLWRAGPHEFRADFAGVTADGAEWLVSRKLRLIGVDYLSVGPKGMGRPTHEILLKAGVIIVEGLDFSKVSPGSYTLHCLPLKLKDSDGAPARAILVET